MCWFEEKGEIDFLCLVFWVGNLVVEFCNSEKWCCMIYFFDVKGRFGFVFSVFGSFGFVGYEGEVVIVLCDGVYFGLVD